jgi:hypothetical protein
VPVAEDGSALVRRVSRGQNAEESLATAGSTSSHKNNSISTVLRMINRFRVRYQGSTVVGIALGYVPNNLSTIPTGVAALAPDELRAAQATGPDCQNFLSLSALQEL